MMEDDALICAHCEKVIRYERPLFCPFCGKPVDATQGLDLNESEVRIYSASRSAPRLLHIFLIWMGLMGPVAYFWGRSGILWLSVVSLALLVFIFVVSALTRVEKST